MRNGDFSISYCHLSECLVKKGDCVRPGEVVGISGNTGRSTGPHLHLTVRMGRRHLDPGILLRFIDETRRQALEKLSNYGFLYAALTLKTFTKTFIFADFRLFFIEKIAGLK